jgi:hypothetical protein
VYGSPNSATNPKHLKAFGNLVTKISSIHFNHTSELMVMSSPVKKDQLRLVSDLRPLWIRMLTILSGTSSVVVGLFELANIKHSSWQGHRYQLFAWERISCHREFSWKGPTLWNAPFLEPLMLTLPDSALKMTQRLHLVLRRRLVASAWVSMSLPCTLITKFRSLVALG